LCVDNVMVSIVFIYWRPVQLCRRHSLTKYNVLQLPQPSLHVCLPACLMLRSVIFAGVCCCASGTGTWGGACTDCDTPCTATNKCTGNFGPVQINAICNATIKN
jgi:hypothetical protein